ncbi:uncharacterized protein LOC124708419 [Lolium rigidum]|uniref:uncharacterized protein LOC124708419 n=1 Tax=Lolium rigidum TaxID=89674 RepID=UPI001F5E0692|nr:uncharacterized protein LOC124708419 [Lolium rigidum]
MSSEWYGCGPFDRCVGSCISEGFNLCRCYDESDQEAYWADCCLEPSSDSRAGFSEAFLASGSKSPEKIWDDWADGATSNSTAIPRAPVVATAPKEWGDSGGLSEAFLAAGSKSPEKIWDDWADGATSSSTAIPRAPAVASAPKEWGDSGGSTSHSMSIPPALTLTDVTLADGGRAFDCSACCLPLKPPIFQCDQGHTVCLTCLKALSWEGSAAAARCNVSGGHHTDGYRRNQPLENAVEAICVTCPNAAYGCTDLLTRYFLPTHRRSCSYALIASCPQEACSFIGSAEALLDHFISVEKWPYTAETQAGKSFDIHLLGGFNVVGAVRGTSQHLLVLFVARRPFGSTVSAICISPQPKDISWLRPPPQTLKCELDLHFLAAPNSQTSKHDVITSFDVPCTNPSHGLPDPDDFFQFSVPKSVHPDDNAAIEVTASITIYQ